MHVKELCRTAHEESRRNGWYDSERNLGEMIALMHSEASEMLEAIRKPDPETGAPKMSDKIPDFTLLEEEAADLMIRLADFAEHTKLRLEDAISAKLAFNRTRGYRQAAGARCPPARGQRMADRRCRPGRGDAHARLGSGQAGPAAAGVADRAFQGGARAATAAKPG